LHKTQLAGKLLQEEPLSGSHVHIGKKTVSSDVSGNYLIKRLPSGNAKIFVSCIGFQPVDTLVNIAFDQVLNFILLENTVQLQEVVIRQKSIH
jgi:iron complex outermembrane receptor protein